MPAATSDTWNNPQITPPPPSPAIVGTRYRNTSPSADPDYEARYPEAPVSLSEPTTPVDTGPSPISRQPSVSKLQHRSESEPKTTSKKKRARAPGAGAGAGREGEDDPGRTTPRLSRSQYRQPGPGYNNVPFNYYPPPPQYQSSLDGYSGHGRNHSHTSPGEFSGHSYYSNYYRGGRNSSYSPPSPSHIYPLPTVEYDSSYYGNPYTPAHLSHPVPSPSPGTTDVFTFTEPGLEYSKQPKSRSQEGLGEKYYENGKGNGVQNGGGLSMKTIGNTEEKKEEKEEHGNPVGKNLTEKPERDIGVKEQTPIPYPSSPLRSPRLPPPPQYRPTGYPLLAKTLSTTPSLQLYRRFSTLNHLVLLHLQDEISELENILSELDEQEYTMSGGAGLRARRGMGVNSRRLQVMGAIAFKLQQYNQALKGYTDMNEALESATEEDIKRHKEWMETSRPLVKAEDATSLSDTKKSLKPESKKYLPIEAAEGPFSPAFKLGVTALSCGIAGLAKWRVSQAASAGVEVSLALAAGATGGIAAMMWAFL